MKVLEVVTTNRVNRPYEALSLDRFGIDDLITENTLVTRKVFRGIEFQGGSVVRYLFSHSFTCPLICYQILFSSRN